MTSTFDEVELRVLGVLIEKSLAHPGGYPLTFNSIVLGANQSQNREPVTAFTDGQVSEAIRRLTHRGVVAQATLAAGARTVRIEHHAVEAFHWDQREQAIMAELILRGPQTSGELRARAGRMTPLTDLVAVNALLEGLMQADPPFAAELPREPGRSANRFRHLLSSEDAPVSATAVVGATEDAPVRARPAPEDLGVRVARLEEEVAELKRMVSELCPSEP